MTYQVLARRWRPQRFEDLVGQDVVVRTLRNALAALCDADTLRQAGIDPGARGETLAVADFVRLANALAR